MLGFVESQHRGLSLFSQKEKQGLQSPTSYFVLLPLVPKDNENKVMSRWDALKPKNQRDEQSQRSRWSNLNRGRDLEESLGMYLAEKRVTHAIEVAKILLENLDDLPGEKVLKAFHVMCLHVSEPTLEPQAEVEQLVAYTLTLLRRILHNKDYLSSLMGPLVQNVSASGKEEQVANPKRQAAFSVTSKLISDILHGKHTSISTEIDMNKSLIGLLDAASLVDGPKKHGGETSCDIDPRLVADYVVLCLSRKKPISSLTEQKEICLKVLRALLQRHPDASRTITVQLLSKRDDPRSKPSLKHRFSGNIFLNFIVYAPSSVQCVGSSCIRLLLSSCPFDLWLKQPQNGGNSLSQFQRLVIACLENAMEVTTYLVSKSPPIPNAHEMVAAIFRVFPGACATPSTRIGFHLCGAVIDSLLQTPPKSLIDTVVDLCGGRATPTGSATAMSPLLENYLSSQFSERKLVGLTRAGFIATEPSAILQAFVRSKVNILASDGVWEPFCAAYSNSSNNMLRLEVAEAVLAGRLLRKEQGCKDSTKIVNLFKDVIDSTLPVEASNTYRRLVFSSFGSLLSGDWSCLGVGEVHIAGILDFCTDQDQNAKIRSQACKAVGDVCTEYFVSACKDKTVVANLVLGAMATLLNDLKAPVRCMALFAIGNLLMAANLQRGQKWSHSLGLSEIALLVHGCLHDDDEKVKGNAIRSLGHVTVFLLRSSNAQNEFLDMVMSSYDDILASAFDEHVNRRLTWKQRSASRKHAWGAAFALGQIIEAIDDMSRYQSNIVRLLECVAKADHLHDKIVFASSAALQRVAEVTFAKPAFFESLVEAEKLCLTKLYPRSYQPSRPQSGDYFEPLLLHLLRSSSQHQCDLLLKELAGDEAILNALCDVLVYHKEQTIFVKLGVSMSKPGIVVNFAVEQRFAAALMDLVLGDSGPADEL